jgi:hypothetical protein
MKGVSRTPLGLPGEMGKRKPAPIVETKTFQYGYGKGGEKFVGKIVATDSTLEVSNEDDKLTVVARYDGKGYYLHLFLYSAGDPVVHAEVLASKGKAGCKDEVLREALSRLEGMHHPTYERIFRAAMSTAFGSNFYK